jgi:pyrophosphate--fructose-6-phosphate 1-phosphotransferase
MDENNNNLLSCIDFNRIKGGKPFDTNADWFIEILNEIGQK